VRNVAIAVAVTFAFLGLMGCSGSHVSTALIRCPTGDSLSCYYVGTNRPVNGDQSISFEGGTVPVVGVLSDSCSTYGACVVLGSVGAYQVWQTGGKGSSHLEAVYSPDAVSTST
jgi:hypothetical protein